MTPLNHPRLFSLFFVLLAATAQFASAQSVWNGAGVTGGTTDNIWNTAANWNPAAVPSAVDASLTFNTGTTVVNVNTGAPAVNNVTLTNSGGTGQLNIAQSSFTMASITGGTGSLLLNGGARTAIFTGNGDVYKSTGALASLLDGGDIIRFTGSNLTFATTWAGAGDFTFGTTNSGGSQYFVQINNTAATVDFNSKNLLISGSNGGLTVAGGQTWNNNPQINFTGRSLSLTNSNTSVPLSMANTALNWDNSPTGSGNFNIAGGTYKGIQFRQANGQTCSMVLQGDVTVSGTTFSGVTLSNNNAAAVGSIDLNGKTLHSSNSGATPVIASSGTGTNRLLLNSGTFRSANGLLVNANGAIAGSGTVRIDGGRLVFNSTKTAVTDMTLSTINLTSGATGIDWNSGSIDIDATNDSSNFIASNFVVGALTLGGGSYNIAGGSTHDLLINGALTIGAGGVLSLGNWTGVTAGGDAQTLAFNGLSQLANVQNLLSSGQITATGLGSGLQLGIVQGNSNDMFYVAAVPEPSTAATVILGFVLLIGLQRVHRR